MTKQTKVMVYARYRDLRGPVLTIISSPAKRQVVLTQPGAASDLHATIHADEPHPLLTILDAKKHQTWRDEETVKIARKLGYRDPERHGNYLRHAPLSAVTNAGGYVVVGFETHLLSAEDKPKYQRREHIEIEARASSFMLWVDLSTTERPITRPEEPCVGTPVGHLFFRFEPLPPTRLASLSSSAFPTGRCFPPAVSFVEASFIGLTSVAGREVELVGATDSRAAG